jgi:hypothetical protein
MRHAVERLEQWSDLGSWEKLELALTYGIPEWVERVVPLLIDIPLYLRRLREKEIARQFPDTTELIDVAQTKLDQERCSIGAIPPSLLNGTDSCPFAGPKHVDSECARIWNESWTMRFTPEFLCPFPDAPSFSNGYDLIRNLTCPGMNEGCRAAVIERVVNSGKFDMESNLKRLATDKIKALLPMGPMTV